MKKAYSMQFEFLSVAIISIILAALFIGTVCIYEIDNYVESSTKELIDEKCEKEAAQINALFTSMEKSVEVMNSYVLRFISGVQDLESDQKRQDIINKAEIMFLEIAQNTNDTVAFYVRFNPDITSGTSGIFYSKTKDEQGFVKLEPTDILKYSQSDTEHVGWYWDPYKAQRAIWMKPYYNQNIEVMMISYVIPMYSQGEFIGVIGMDFDYNTLVQRVHEIRIYENGYAHLEDNDQVIHCIHAEDENHELQPSQKDMQVVCTLRNGMDLVVTAKHSDMRQIRYSIELKTLFVVIGLMITLVLIVILIVRKIVSPLKRLTNAAQKLASNDYDVEIVHGKTKEIKQLSMAFENMITQLRERDKMQQMLAYRDSLTGLKNTTSYKAWSGDLNEKLATESVDFGVVILDINNLKQTNDNFGHDAGNSVIILAARIISETFKRSPVFRIGGDEFLAIVQNKDLYELDELIERFKEKCNEASVSADDHNIPISIACGSAVYNPKNDKTFLDVFNRADEAMYENKRKMKESAKEFQ